MADPLTRTIRENYDKLAKEYALHLFDELQHKPFDREVLTRFAHHTNNGGAVCDLGCGPGHVTRFLNDLQASVFGVDVSPNMVAEARRLNPGLDFREGGTAIGALAIGRLAVGAFVMKRGRVRTLTVDNLEVRRLHVGELIIDSGVPR